MTAQGGTPDRADLSIDGVRGGEHRVINHLFHDFKGGLSTVIMCLEALRDALGEGASPQAGRPLELAERTASRLVELINNYRDLTQMFEGEFPLEPEDVDLAALVPELLATLEAAARSRAQVVELRVDGALGPVQTRARLLSRVLRLLLPHLLDNTSTGGQFHVEIACAAGRLGVRVRLEGVQHDQALLDSVFDRLEQTRFGLQLGRAYTMLFCRTAARTLGGDLRLSPWKGKGTTVELTLPVTDVKPAT